jgi:uncharacterized protein (DUF2062 family)
MKKFKKIIAGALGGVRRKLNGIAAEPHKVTLGYALGVFLAASPFIGLKVFIAIALTFLLKWNKVAAIIGVFHINLLTAPVFYGFSFWVGKTVLGSDVSFHFSWPITFKTLLELATTNSIIFMSLLTGGVVLGIPMAVAAYFLSNTIIRRKPLLKPVV